MHWCATKELTRLCSSSATVVGYDLVVSNTKLWLTVLNVAFSLTFSSNKVCNNTIQCAPVLNFYWGGGVLENFRPAGFHSFFKLFYLYVLYFL